MVRDNNKISIVITVEFKSLVQVSSGVADKTVTSASATTAGLENEIKIGLIINRHLLNYNLLSLIMT